MLQMITELPPACSFAIGKLEQTSSDTKIVIFTINEFYESKSADGLNRFYSFNSVYRPHRVCHRQTRIKNVLGFLGAAAPKQCEERKVGFREKGKPLL